MHSDPEHAEATVQVIRESTVDIQKKSRELGVFSDGELRGLNENQRIGYRWLKARTILFTSTGIIGTILLASFFTLALSEDAEARNWSRQTLTALMGFAAGAIWTSSQGGKSDED